MLYIKLKKQPNKNIVYCLICLKLISQFYPGYPQVPLPDGLCGAEKLTGIIKNILHIVQDTMPITFQMAAAELRAEGVDIVSDEGIQQLACYMNGK